MVIVFALHRWRAARTQCRPKAVAVDSVAPGYTQPLGDWTQLPAGKLVNRWRGEKMDLGLGIEVLMQKAKRAKNVPAGTSSLCP